jgi:hypothetical protein
VGIFKEVQNVTNLTEKQSFIRKNINLWADTYNNPAFKNFGDKINFLSIVYYPLDIFVIQTMLESRVISKNSKPYSASNKDKPLDTDCKYFEPEDIDPWRLNLNLAPSGFVSEHHTITVQNSSHLQQCVSCKGKGENPCASCNSKGSIVCESCSGVGQKGCTSCGGTGNKICTYCLGVGRQNVQKSAEKTDENGMRQQSFYYENVLCIYCNGRGNFKCNSCSLGVITCNKCSGSKVVTCETCSGVGYKNCEACSGAGNILWSLSVNQDFKVFDGVLAFVHPEVKKNFPGFVPSIERESFNIQNIHEYENNAKLSTVSALAFMPSSYTPGNSYSESITQLIEKEISREPGRLLKQKLSFRQSDMYAVAFEYLGKKYTLISHCSTESIYAPNSPFTELAAEYIQKAQEEIPKKHYGQAMKWAEEAYDLSKGSNSVVIADSLIKDLTRMMNYHYLLGISLGSGIYWIIQVLMNIIKGTSFNMESFIKNTVLVLLVFALLKAFERHLSNFVPKIIVKTDNLRVIIGATATAILLHFLFVLLSIF